VGKDFNFSAFLFSPSWNEDIWLDQGKCWMCPGQTPLTTPGFHPAESQCRSAWKVQWNHWSWHLKWKPDVFLVSRNALLPHRPTLTFLKPGVRVQMEAIYCVYILKSYKQRNSKRDICTPTFTEALFTIAKM
jgi:hypothetical protein